ncbi:MAG: hypothetical protein GY842_18750, partial [bacterium]|nr:hypothetical protein [bacterium]
ERVCEGQPTAWTGNCDGVETVYEYDESGNLAHVCSAATESGCGQERFFTRDNRGFLVSERHPEIGPTGNGWISYTYDVLGNVLSKTVAGTSEFDLRFTYDPASRLIRVDEVTGPVETRPLKEFYYARTNSGTDLRKGKLTRAKRHNWVDVVGPLLDRSGNLDAVISDSYRYEGLDGRTSLRQTSYQLNATTFAFRTSYEYDQQGNVSEISYPRCLHNRCVGLDPERKVEYGYTRGFLTSVPGFASSLTYQNGGMLHRMVHSNGVTWKQTINATDRIRRPHEIKTLGVTTGNWTTGVYGYDGAGNVQQIGAQRYQYDRLSRLVMGQVQVDGQVRTQTVTYDDFGNIKKIITNGSTRNTPVNSLTNRLTSAAYDAGGNLTGITLDGV